MKRSRFFLGVGGALLVILLSVIVWAVATGNLGRPILWQFTPGYRGWVVVEYENPACPPLVTEGVYLVIRVPASGRACTSSPIPVGWRYGRYEYVFEDGRRRVIPSSGWDSNSEITLLSVNFEKKLEFLFVGTKQALKESWKNLPH